VSEGALIPGRAGKLAVDLDAGTVTFDGQAIPVTDKEYAVLELLYARVVAGRGAAEIRVGPLTVNIETQLADVAGQRLQLTRKEFAVLQLLALNRERPVSKEMLLLHLYNGRSEPEPKIIDVYLCRLRQKLADAAGGRSFIETRRGQGYLLRDPERLAAERERDASAA
jgi:two-component system cell cycle response regulator CtrA